MKTKKDETISFAEIKRKCRGEWVLIVDPVVDEQMQVVRGHLMHHSKDEQEIHQAAMRVPKGKNIAVLFLGRPPKGVEFAL